MRLSKIFRKYSRVLMLVVMSLLLVVFLVGDVIGRAAQSRSQAHVAFGTAFGREISNTDLLGMRNDLEVLGLLGLPAPPVIASDERQRWLAVYLMFEEAEQMGFRASRARVMELLNSRGVTGPHLARVRDTSSRSLESIYQLVGKWLSIFDAASLQTEVLDVSVPRMEMAYRDQEQEAVVKLSVIESRAFLPLVAEPTEEELQAHFEAAKDREAAHEEGQLVFGYRLPDRVQVEYLTVDPRDIQSKVSVREREARRYHRDHQEDYVKRVPRSTGQQTQPASPEFEEIELGFEEAEERVREDCRAAKAVQEAQRLVNLMQQEALRPWSAAPYGEDHFRVPPPEERMVSFEALRDKHGDPYEVIYNKTELVDLDGLGREPGLGRSGYRPNERQAPIMAGQLALRVKGLITPEANDPVPVLNLYEPSRVLFEYRWDPRTRQRYSQAYFFRVVQVAPSGPPESMEVVRDEVVSDFKLLKAHELAEGYAEQLAEQAREVGLEGALEAAEELKQLLAAAEEQASSQPVSSRPQRHAFERYLGPFAPTERFTRIPSYVHPYVDVVRSLHEQVFALAESPTSTGPVHRVTVVQAAGKQRWIVAELEEVKPIYAGAFELRLAEIARSRRLEAWREFGRVWYEADNILRRVGFEWAPPPER